MREEHSRQREQQVKKTLEGLNRDQSGWSKRAKGVGEGVEAGEACGSDGAGPCRSKNDTIGLLC